MEGKSSTQRKRFFTFTSSLVAEPAPGIGGHTCIHFPSSAVLGHLNKMIGISLEL